METVSVLTWKGILLKYMYSCVMLFFIINLMTHIHIYVYIQW